MFDEVLNTPLIVSDEQQFYQLQIFLHKVYLHKYTKIREHIFSAAECFHCL